MIKSRRLIEMTMTVKERDTKIAAATYQLTILDAKIARLFQELETLKAERNEKQTDLLDLKMAITRRTDREKLADAFKKLRAAGYFARMGLGTPDTCWDKVPEGSDRVVVYDSATGKSAFAKKGTGVFHRGRWLAESAEQSDDLQGTLYISHKSPDPWFIVNILQEEGLNATWDGNQWSTINVDPDPEA
jgi:hypothetical protein